MDFDILRLLGRREGENLSLHESHVNPQFARALRLIGFDNAYVRGEGATLYDAQGNAYLDMLAGYGVWNVGRAHPIITRALRDVLDSGYPALAQMEAPLASGLLAERLKKTLRRDDDIVYFTSGGAETVESAIKFVRAAAKRPAVLFADSAFHGLSTGALALNGSEIFRNGFGPLMPHCRSVPYNDPEALDAAFEQGDVAALVLEPIQGKTVRVASDDYLRHAARICRKHDALLVADEIQCGMGRSGKFLAYQHVDGVEPDIILLSKALSGGYVPVGAAVMRKDVHHAVFSSLDRAVVHSSTFGQGTLAMVAGIAALEALEQDDLINAAKRKGDLLLNRLRELKDKWEFIADVRGRGLMIGIEFGEPQSAALRLAWKTVNRMSEDLFCQAAVIPLMRDYRILTQVAANRSKTIKLLPPLTISEAEIDYFVNSFNNVLKAMHRFPGPAWQSLRGIAANALPWRR